LGRENPSEGNQHLQQICDTFVSIAVSLVFIIQHGRETKVSIYVPKVPKLKKRRVELRRPPGSLTIARLVEVEDLLDLVLRQAFGEPIVFWH
jgi:hypothetical protein